jgi:hypothetical protein
MELVDSAAAVGDEEEIAQPQATLSVTMSGARAAEHADAPWLL